MNDIAEYIRSVCLAAKAASPELALAQTSEKDAVLRCFAELLRKNTPEILAANEKDLRDAKKAGISDAMCDRLRLNAERLEAIAAATEALAALPDPVGRGEVFRRPNGLVIRKIRVPLGLIGVIFEARPNVSADLAGLAIKSGNAVVLRGGKEALGSNTEIVRCAREALASCGMNPDAVSLISRTEHEGADALMNMRGTVDVLIPRGGRGLIRRVAESSSVPVIETGAGNCHIYVHSDADADMALSVIANAKLSRPSVCNAVETVLVHRSICESFLPRLADALGKTELRGDKTVCGIINALPASDEDWETEYNDFILTVGAVGSIEEAAAHINRFSTGHSESIITESRRAAEYFTSHIDSACVYVNASTRFTDGGEFGFGAEVGISTQKLHARGPMGLEALTTCKYIIEGSGQIRN